MIVFRNRIVKGTSPDPIYRYNYIVFRWISQVFLIVFFGTETFSRIRLCDNVTT